MPSSPVVSFPLVPGQPDVEFRFTIRTARALEREARPFGGIEMLRYRGSNVEVLVMLTFHALAWRNDRKWTEDKAVDLIQTFVDGGGNVVELTHALGKALSESGVYGAPESTDENPTTTAATNTTPTLPEPEMATT